MLIFCGKSKTEIYPYNLCIVTQKKLKKPVLCVTKILLLFRLSEELKFKRRFKKCSQVSILNIKGE